MEPRHEFVEVEPAGDLAERLIPGIIDQIYNLPMPKAWGELFYPSPTTTYLPNGLGFPLMRMNRKEPNNPYEAVINLFRDYCRPAEDNFFISHKHSYTRLISVFLEKVLNKYEIKIYSQPELHNEVLKFFFQGLEEELRANNQYLNPTGSLVKRINFAQVLSGFSHSSFRIKLAQLCLDLSNEMISLRKNQAGVVDARDEKMGEEKGIEEKGSTSFGI
jgi:hypothetical protein